MLLSHPQRAWRSLRPYPIPSERSPIWGNWGNLPISYGEFPPTWSGCQQGEYKYSVKLGRQEKNMEYTYYLPNASLTLRIIEYLHATRRLPVAFVTVIHQIDGWVMKIKLRSRLDAQEEGDFRAYLNEVGFPYQPEIRVQMALWSLETGQSPINVMRRYQVAVVSHGSPNRREIEEFRKQFVQGLGYCPETLA